MNSNNDISTSRRTAGRVVAGLVAVSIAVFAAGLIASGSTTAEPNNAQQASEDAGSAAPDTGPLAFSEQVDPCSLTLPEAIASHGNMADGLQAWSHHLRQIAGSAPDDVTVALDALATDYAALANAQSATLSESASQVIESASDNAAASQLVDTYLESNCT